MNIIPIDKKHECPFGSYFLTLMDGVVVPFVCIPSMLHTNNSIQTIQNMVNDGEISTLQATKVIENMHTGTPKGAYLLQDDSISTTIDVNALILTIQGSFLEGVVTKEMDTKSALDALIIKGYYICNTIEGNLNG